MSLASLDDVNTHLPRDKFEANDGNPEIALFGIDVERVIKGYLASVFSATTLSAWVSPATTPGEIRAIAGRLIAAFYYSKKVSEDMPDWDRTYPQRLYDEAMKMLTDIIDGEIVLTDVTETPGTVLSGDFFFPTAADGEPKFTMGMRW